MFYVYRRTGRGRSSSWKFLSEHPELKDAEAAAIGCVPKGQTLYTEPGKSLDRGYFGSNERDGWCSRITLERDDQAE
jgi:hypothetical protein